MTSTSLILSIRCDRLLLATRQRIRHRLNLVDRGRAFRPSRSINGGLAHGTGILRCDHSFMVGNRPVHTDTGHLSSMGYMGYVTRETGPASADC